MTNWQKTLINLSNMEIEEFAKTRIYRKTIYDWSDEFELYFGDFGEGKSGHATFKLALKAEIKWLKKEAEKENNNE